MDTSTKIFILFVGSSVTSWKDLHIKIVDAVEKLDGDYDTDSEHTAAVMKMIFLYSADMYIDEYLLGVYMVASSYA